MNSIAEVVVLVEGQTEERFIKRVLAPYMAPRRVYLTAIVLNKPGQNGGDVKFSRAKNDIQRHIKQRAETWITLMVDYYGIKGDWPGYAESKQQTDHFKKAEIMNQATAEAVKELIPKQNTSNRFIPYISMHEMEALYFSDPACLARHLGVDQSAIENILKKCGEPEKVNDHQETAPSKRLQNLSGRFKKTTTGITIAQEIGIEKMRESCPIFDAWVSKMDSVAKCLG